MNPMASGVDKIKGFVHDLVKGRDYSSRRNPIEILKRLQRESFSDLGFLSDKHVVHLISHFRYLEALAEGLNWLVVISTLEPLRFRLDCLDILKMLIQ